VEKGEAACPATGAFSSLEMRDLLAIPLGCVMGYLSRARQKLRAALADEATQRGLLRRPVAGEGRP
jgi:hypothetical protein